MPEYRRAFLPGGTFFFTLVAYQRRPLFSDSGNVQKLRESMRQVREERPFDLMAAVILPDHLHFIMTLPTGDADYSRRLGQIKARFTRMLTDRTQSNSNLRSSSRKRHRESDVWQRRFWEHAIRDETDFQRHFDYIHYNPVRHGLAQCPHQWQYSTFAHWVRQKAYDPEWCCACKGSKVTPPYPKEMENRAGE
jgi:putative transposase